VALKLSKQEYIKMGRVIGIPLTKGNSEVIVAVEIQKADIAATVEGQAVFLVDGSPVSAELVVAKERIAGSTFYGFVFDINLCTGYASCIRSAESVYLPSTDGAAFSTGDQVTINPTTGLIEAGASVLTNGVVILPDVTNILTKKGVALDQSGVCIRILGGREVNAVVPVVAAQAKGAKA
jgi:hypothetical protein